MEYRVKTLRDAGLEAKWGKTRQGAPMMFARNPNGAPHQRNSWWAVDSNMWDAMKRNGVLEGFHNATLLADFFSVRL